jgi:hypothetical protein
MKVLATSASLTRMLLVVVMFLLAAAAWEATAARATGPTLAMSAECHQAYRGYMEATDPAEADFWAESWMTFGCETGGGYWA